MVSLAIGGNVRRPVVIECCEWLDSTTLVLTWSWLDGAPVDTLATLEYQRADLSVGLGAGYSVHCDAPLEIEACIAELAADRD